MKIAFDAQSLLEENKTGIGWTIEKVLENMEILPCDEYQLNYFALKNKKQKRQKMKLYERIGYATKECGWFPLGLYRRLWNIVPIPYSFFMGRDADITQFFNFVIPPGVKGKKVVYIYDMVYKAYPETMEESTRVYMEQNVKKSCQRADFIITISEFSKREIVKYLGVSEQMISVVPCGVDLSMYHTKISQTQVKQVTQLFAICDRYFLYLGTLEPRKNVTLIIKAYYQLKHQSVKKMPQLVLAGKKGWGYDDIFRLIKEYKLETDVIFTGYVTEEEKVALLKGAVCFIYPSLYEGFGMPPLEAMACGTPVIASNAASLPEVIGDSGILIDPESIEDLKKSMLEINENSQLRNKLSYEGAKRAQNYDWRKIAVQLKELYKKML